MNLLRCRPAADTAAANTKIIVPNAVAVVMPWKKNRAAKGKLAASTNARRLGRWDAFVTTAPAHMPPITKVRKICPGTVAIGNITTPPRPQHMPASSDPQAASCDHQAMLLASGPARRYRNHKTQRPVDTSRATPSQTIGMTAFAICRSTMAVRIAFTVLTASAIGICRNMALTCVARISLRASSRGPNLRPKKLRISPFPRAREECGTAVAPTTEPRAVPRWPKDIRRLRGARAASIGLSHAWGVQTHPESRDFDSYAGLESFTARARRLLVIQLPAVSAILTMF